MSYANESYTRHLFVATQHPKARPDRPWQVVSTSHTPAATYTCLTGQPASKLRRLVARVAKTHRVYYDEFFWTQPNAEGVLSITREELLTAYHTLLDADTLLNKPYEQLRDVTRHPYWLRLSPDVWARVDAVTGQLHALGGGLHATTKAMGAALTALWVDESAGVVRSSWIPYVPPGEGRALVPPTGRQGPSDWAFRVARVVNTVGLPVDTAAEKVAVEARMLVSECVKLLGPAPLEASVVCHQHAGSAMFTGLVGCA